MQIYADALVTFSESETLIYADLCRRLRDEKTRGPLPSTWINCWGGGKVRAKLVADEVPLLLYLLADNFSGGPTVYWRVEIIREMLLMRQP